MAVPDGWPPARESGCTEPGLQAGSPAAHGFDMRFGSTASAAPTRLGGGVIHGPPLSGGQIDGVDAASNTDWPGAATTAGGLASIVSQLSPGQGERGAAAGSAQTQTSHSRWGY